MHCLSGERQLVAADHMIALDAADDNDRRRWRHRSAPRVRALGDVHADLTVRRVGQAVEIDEDEREDYTAERDSEHTSPHTIYTPRGQQIGIPLFGDRAG